MTLQTYNIRVQAKYTIKANNKNEAIDKMQTMLNKNNGSITKVSKINTKCNHCKKEMINKTARAKYCNSSCRSAVHYAKIKQEL